MQKGSVLPFLLIAISVVAGIFGYLYLNQNSDTILQNPTSRSSVEQLKTYTNSNLGFEFNYPQELTVKEEGEEQFNQRGNGDFRKNFTSYVTYAPATVLAVTWLLNKNLSYDANPLTIWVFENPKNLTIEKWYESYWYYPFVWGDYTGRKKSVAPTQEVTIGGQQAQYGIVNYQLGSPKFIYLTSNQRMYLFRVIDGLVGEHQILSTFKFFSSLSDETEQWKVYSSDNYSIKYPSYLTYSTSSYQGIGGDVVEDRWRDSAGNYQFSIFSYNQEVNPKIEFNLESEFATTFYLAGKNAKSVTSKDKTLIHIGPVNNWGINYMFVYSSKKMQKSDIFYQMLSTFKFSK